MASEDSLEAAYILLANGYVQLAEGAGYRGIGMRNGRDDLGLLISIDPYYLMSFLRKRKGGAESSSLHTLKL